MIPRRPSKLYPACPKNTKANTPTDAIKDSESFLANFFHPQHVSAFTFFQRKNITTQSSAETSQATSEASSNASSPVP